MPEEQNRGIGAYVIRQILDYLKNSGFKKISLYTDKINLKAQSCYRNCRFEVEEVFMDTMSNGKEVKRYKMSIQILL